MSEKLIEIRSDSREKIYSQTSTAEIARVTMEFVCECERENLIQATIVQGRKGYNFEAVRRLIRIRHLHQDLGLDFNAVDCILRMRRQIATLQQQLNDMEERMLEREQELLNEIQNLRKHLAQETRWMPT